MAKDPFAMHPSPHTYFESESHASVLRLLKESVDHKEPWILVEGDYGVGKTLICLKIINYLEKLEGRVVVPVSSPVTPYSMFLRSIIQKLGGQMESVHAYTTDGQFEEALFNLYITGQTRKSAYVVIDDLQDYNYTLLDRIRFLANFHVGDFFPFHLVCFSHSGFVEKLERDPKYTPLIQRFRRRMKVQPLQEEELREYIYYRLLKAGARGRPLFDPAALRLIAMFSENIPRKINNICDRILLQASERGIDRITSGLVQETCAVADRVQPEPESKITLPPRGRGAFSTPDQQLNLATIFQEEAAAEEGITVKQSGYRLSLGQILTGAGAIVLVMSLIFFYLS